MKSLFCQPKVVGKSANTLKINTIKGDAMYLNIDILEELKHNYFCFEGWSYIDLISSDKGYEIINHAYDLLKYNSSLYNEDIISNLRKAVNLRTKDIDLNIGFNKISHWKTLNISKQWDRLECLGVVKSLLISKLIKIRNGVEYDGKKAPSVEECNELIDIVWYFYRSTDIFSKVKPDDCLIEYDINGKEYWLSIKFDFEKHELIKISGRFPDGFIGENAENKYSLNVYDFKMEDCSIDNAKNDPKLGKVFYSGYIKTSEMINYVEIIKLILTKWGL